MDHGIGHWHHQVSTNTPIHSTIQPIFEQYTTRSITNRKWHPETFEAMECSRQQERARSASLQVRKTKREMEEDCRQTQLPLITYSHTPPAYVYWLTGECMHAKQTKASLIYIPFCPRSDNSSLSSLSCSRQKSSIPQNQGHLWKQGVLWLSCPSAYMGQCHLRYVSYLDLRQYNILISWLLSSQLDLYFCSLINFEFGLSHN